MRVRVCFWIVLWAFHLDCRFRIGILVLVQLDGAVYVAAKGNNAVDEE